MDTNDEKFFEQLAGAKATADESYEVELAKSSSGVLTTASPAVAKPRVSRAAAKAADPAPIFAEDLWEDGEPAGQLTVDVYQTPEEIIVESAIAGVKPEDIDVNVTVDAVTIRGIRRHEKTVRDEDYLYQECYWGKFARSLILPQEVDPEAADVVFKNGILTVRLPKTNKKKARKLQVRVE